MIMLQIARKHRARLPELVPDADTLDEVGRAVVGGILLGVRNQEQTDGTQIKRNSPGWLDYKRKHGMGERSLAAAGRRLVKGSGGTIASLFSDAPSKSSSSSYDVVVNERVGTVVVRPSTVAQTVEYPGRGTSNMSPRDLLRAVQKKGYRGWFGISEKARGSMRAVLRRFIKRKLRDIA